ncbi:unnamed protein product [Pleuronectes platessa]|uniref:Uncharacterized protein n=1 Tax=Pleuronectes platessa TaxID=8262 RepID=A0A9N7YI47_PLEPL|nr:unnamed protein product [Pleuronectes platessa]
MTTWNRLPRTYQDHLLQSRGEISIIRSKNFLGVEISPHIKKLQQDLQRMEAKYEVEKAEKEMLQIILKPITIGYKYLPYIEEMLEKSQFKEKAEILQLVVSQQRTIIDEKNQTILCLNKKITELEDRNKQLKQSASFPSPPAKTHPLDFDQEKVSDHEMVSESTDSSVDDSESLCFKPDVLGEESEVSDEEPEDSGEDSEISDEESEDSGEESEVSDEEQEVSDEEPEDSEEDSEVSDEEPEDSGEESEVSDEEPEDSEEDSEVSDEEPEDSGEESEVSDEEQEVSDEEPEDSEEDSEVSDEEPEDSGEESEVSDEEQEVSDEEPEDSDEDSEVSDEESEVSDEESDSGEESEVLDEESDSGEEPEVSVESELISPVTAVRAAHGEIARRLHTAARPPDMNGNLWSC